LSHWAHIVPSVGISPFATVKQYSMRTCAPIHPMQATQLVGGVLQTGELSLMSGPSTTTSLVDQPSVAIDDLLVQFPR
jgi:hypothetical protein